MTTVTKFVITPLFQKSASPSVPTSPPQSTDKSPAAPSPYPEQVSDVLPADPNLTAEPYWATGIPLSFDVYIAASEHIGDVLSIEPKPEVTLAHASWSGFKWGDWNIDNNWVGEITLPLVRASTLVGPSPRVKAKADLLHTFL